MELTILKQNEAPLLSRKIVYAALAYTGTTPSNAQVRDALASKANAGKDLVVVKKIATVFGYEKSNVVAYIYDDKEGLEKFENVQKRQKSVAPQPAAQKQDAPKEQKKDE